MQFSSFMNQGTRTWYLCYHSTKLPVTTFVHLDDVLQSTHDTIRFSNFTEEPPDANSTLIEPRLYSQTDPGIRPTIFNDPLGAISSRISSTRSTIAPTGECTSHDVGHMSHIPRIPPSQATFTIPSVINNKSMVTLPDHEEDLYGMVKLKDNDVCYTSGTIEWVGRKRNYPINSGFKVMSDQSANPDMSKKKVRKLNKSLANEVDKLKDCDCADVLPTVNAIVDHLNALHEAVDLVDLRLNSLEEVMTKNE